MTYFIVFLVHFSHVLILFYLRLKNVRVLNNYPHKQVMKMYQKEEYKVKSVTSEKIILVVFSTTILLKCQLVFEHKI